jgi:hypothetical protein
MAAGIADTLRGMDRWTDRGCRVQARTARAIEEAASMSEHCCDRMDYDLNQKCELHPNRYECPDALIARLRDGYGIIVHDGGSSVIRIAFCPWCGRKLDESADIELDGISN